MDEADIIYTEFCDIGSEFDGLVQCQVGFHTVKHCVQDAGQLRQVLQRQLCRIVPEELLLCLVSLKVAAVVIFPDLLVHLFGLRNLTSAPPSHHEAFAGLFEMDVQILGRIVIVHVPGT